MGLLANRNAAKTQIVIVSFIAFCCPGIFNALSGLGGAGSDDPTVANNANTALYATFAIFGYFGGLFFNMFGNRILMGLGGATYCFYAVAQYLAGINDSLGWLAILSGAVLGIGAGLFWTAQGAMMMAYATPEKKGTYISIFWVIFNLGGMCGGLISFALNFHNDVGKASPASYFTFAALMGLGSISAFVFLAPPEDVIREDGEKIQFAPATGPLEEFKNVATMFLNPNMLLMTPLFVSSNWFYTYQFNAVNGGLFSVRSRGFNSAIYWGSQMLGAWAFGQKFLDIQSMNMRKRGLYGLAILGVFFTITYALGLYLQLSYEGGFDVNLSTDPTCAGMIYSPHTNTCRPRLDIANGFDYFFPIIVFLLYGMNDAMLQTYAYWVMGAIADDVDESARFAGYYKGVQSAGAAIAWSIDNTLATNPHSWLIQFGICWALFELSIPTTFMVANKRISAHEAEGVAHQQESEMQLEKKGYEE